MLDIFKLLTPKLKRSKQDSKAHSRGLAVMMSELTRLCLPVPATVAISQKTTDAAYLKGEARWSACAGERRDKVASFGSRNARQPDLQPNSAVPGGTSRSTGRAARKAVPGAEIKTRDYSPVAARLGVLVCCRSLKDGVKLDPLLLPKVTSTSPGK